MRGLDFRAWYLTRQGLDKSVDKEFKASFSWDIDLTSGYSHEFIQIKQPIDMNRFNGVDFAEDFANRLDENDIGVLWVEGWRFRALWNALRIAKKNGVKIWMRGESNLLTKVPLWKQIAKKLFLKPHLQKVDSFLCIGEANRQFYRSYGISEAKLHSAPYCVENDRFARQADFLRLERNKIRSEWGIPEDSKVFLFCGKFVEKKHPDHLLEAVSRLQSSSLHGGDLHILFVGSGPMAGVLRQGCDVVFDVDRGGRQDRSMRPEAIGRVKASFAGFLNQSEVAKAYVASDLMVLPSDAGETWGLVANEAMACGTPVVTSHLVGCSQDLPSKLDPQLVFQFGDLDCLTQTLRRAIDVNYGLNAIRAIADRFHLKHTADCVEEILGGLITNVQKR